MSVNSEKSIGQKEHGNTFQTDANKAKPAKPSKKRRKSKKVSKEISQEEIERKKKLANIVHKKVTVSTNWKNFVGQSLHLDKDGHSGNIKQQNFYKGTFRKNRKNSLPSGSTDKTLMNQSEKSSNIEIKHGQSRGTSADPSESSQNIVKPKSPGPRPTARFKANSTVSADKARHGNETTDLNNKLTKFIGIDCEMVGVDDDRGKDSMLARVSLVNKFGDCIYDKFVQPKEDITDYRTYVSGVRPVDLENAESFETVQSEVAEIIKGRVIVGHSLHNDLKVLYLSHPRKRIRDTSKYDKFRQLNKGRTPSLKKLASIVLGVTIQEGEHSPVIDAKAAMQLYMMYQKEWEAELRTRKGKKSKPRLHTKQQLVL